MHTLDQQDKFHHAHLYIFIMCQPTT
uniref:Uncharacterized protein n=1 Tax=Rhizophora mucronata TaxID=61149 RepID=A0A2P2R4U5_RHIMU